MGANVPCALERHENAEKGIGLNEESVGHLLLDRRVQSLVEERDDPERRMLHHIPNRRIVLNAVFPFQMGQVGIALRAAHRPRDPIQEFRVAAEFETGERCVFDVLKSVVWKRSGVMSDNHRADGDLDSRKRIRGDLTQFAVKGVDAPQLFKCRSILVFLRTGLAERIEVARQPEVAHRFKRMEQPPLVGNQLAIYQPIREIGVAHWFLRVLLHVLRHE